MKRTFIAAFNELKKLGAPVYVHPDDRGNFSIDAESSEEWADYYSEVNPKIEKVLQRRGLFAEWVNPGRLAVYQA
jgi:hypothetical protein